MGFLDSVKDMSKKAGDAAKEKYNEEKAKSDALKELRGKHYKSLQIEFIGGYEDYKQSKGILAFYENRVEYKSPMNYSFALENEHVKTVAIEGQHEVNRRVTVTRLLAVGIFAFALKKKQEEKEAYITFEMSNGKEIVFKVKDKSPHQLKGELASAMSAVKSAPKEPQIISTDKSSAHFSAADELVKLGALKQQGLLTQEEFDQEKARLLS